MRKLVLVLGLLVGVGNAASAASPATWNGTGVALAAGGLYAAYAANLSWRDSRASRDVGNALLARGGLVNGIPAEVRARDYFRSVRRERRRARYEQLAAGVLLGASAVCIGRGFFLNLRTDGAAVAYRF